MGLSQLELTVGLEPSLRSRGASGVVSAMATTRKKSEAKTKPAKVTAKAAASADTAGEHERVVLIFEEGKSDKVWIAERRGATWTATFGRRTLPERSVKPSPAKTAEAAALAMQKAVAAKEKEGYRRAPSGADALRIIEKGLGVVAVEKGGEVLVSRVVPWSDKGNAWIPVGGQLVKFSYGKHVYVHTLDEVAAVVAARVGESTYFAVNQPGGGIESAVTVR